jgi:hypothetical protein
MISKECLISFKKLILVGPQYLTPLIDGIHVLFIINFATVPEKLAKRFLLEVIKFKSFLGMHIKFPNFIE